MWILLPPSEAKAGAGTGPALDLEALSHAGPHGLTPIRKRVLAALTKLSRRRDAAEVLGLSPGQAADLEHNRSLHTAPTRPAGDLYTGVLYDRLGLASLAHHDRERAARSLLVFSGIWGAVGIDDQIPPYRLSMGVRLPPLGPLTALWRPALSRTLGRLDGLLVDMRSSAYASAWRPGEQAVSVRVLRETAGRRSVVSHMAKATRGDVARALLRTREEPRTGVELAETLTALGYTVELTPAPRPSAPASLDVVLPG